MKRTDKRSPRAILRIVLPILVLAVIALGFILSVPLGTVSAFGWKDVSLLCPLGALSTMLASRLAAPRPLISLAVAVIAILLFGRAFCAYVCPTPLVARLRQAVGGEKRSAGADEAETGAEGALEARAESPQELTPEEKQLLKGCERGCSDCAPAREALDSRHLVLGGALLSAAVFGFPVFCLICPIGLTFATVMLLVLLFGGGDVTIAVLLAPVLLILEVVVFRKWCGRVCPLSALMGLIGHGNRTFVPTVDQNACIGCGQCTQACEIGIDPCNPRLGTSMAECTKCGACVDACPASALSMPFLPKAKAAAPAVEGPEHSLGEAPCETASQDPEAVSPKSAE